jgi:hypothetical protein
MSMIAKSIVPGTRRNASLRSDSEKWDGSKNAKEGLRSAELKISKCLRIDLSCAGR